MPAWLVLAIAVVGGVVTLAGFWQKVVRPLARTIALGEQTVPLLQELNKQLGGTPNAFAILGQIIAQFRTDSGSSLRDVVDRLEKAANDNKAAAEILKVNVEVVKQLAERDREKSLDQSKVLDRLETQVAATLAGIARIDNAASLAEQSLELRRQLAEEMAANSAVKPA